MKEGAGSMKIKPIWIEDGIVKIIAQTLLPGEYKVLEVGTIEEMWQAIKVLSRVHPPLVSHPPSGSTWM